MNWIKTKDKLPEKGQRILIKTIDCDTVFLVGKFFRNTLEGCWVELIPSFGCECCTNHEVLFYINEFSHWIALDDIDKPID